jgi:polyhydroxyalkanoate synthase subunit PhaC
MNNPDKTESMPLSHSHAASQRDAASGLVRERGPHPLPVFLASVAAACGADSARLGRVLAGLRRYQSAPPLPPRTLNPEIARIGAVSLRDHGGDGPLVVLVPSLINPPDILDLAPGNSLAAGLTAAGLHVLTLDWGEPEPHGLAEAVSSRLVPLIAGLDRPVALVGYCLGGTLALAATALLGDRVRRLALLATPWHFSGYDDSARAGLAAWWAGVLPIAQSLGSVPMDLLQPAFWSLDPESLAAKFEAFGAATGDSDAFVRLEDWANGGVPLSIAAAHDLAETLFAANASGQGRWQVGGTAIDAGALSLPILDVIAGRDRIVPPATALSTAGPGTPLVLDAGHVGMVVGRRAPEQLWGPLARWLGED